MTPAEFKEARRKLGLTGAEMSRVLGLSARTVRGLEQPAGTARARRVTQRVERDVNRLLDGYRPPEWPTRKL